MDRPAATTNERISSPDATGAKIGRSCRQGHVPACVLPAHPPLLRPDDVTHRGILMSAVDKKLQELGITLPTPAAPVANYVPFVRTGNLVIISGQLCLGLDGKIADAHKGKVGAEVSPEVAQQAARLCA